MAYCGQKSSATGHSWPTVEKNQVPQVIHGLLWRKTKKTNRERPSMDKN